MIEPGSRGGRDPDARGRETAYVGSRHPQIVLLIPRVPQALRMNLALTLLALAAVLAWAAWLWRALEDARLALAELDADLERLTVDVPRERYAATPRTVALRSRQYRLALTLLVMPAGYSLRKTKPSEEAVTPKSEFDI